MTKREAAIVSAYTGILIGTFSDMQLYADKLFGYPTFTHEYGDIDFVKKLKELATNDFMNIEVK